MCPTRGVWVLVEQQDEKLCDGCLEVVGEGAKIADKLNDKLTAVIAGGIATEQAQILARYGVGHIVSIRHPALSPYSVEIHAQVLAEVIKEHSPEVILAVDSVNGNDLSCRVAARLGTGLVTACDRIDVNNEGLLVQTKPVYGGKASATFVCPSARPQMATVNPDAIELRTPDTEAAAEVISLEVRLETEKSQTRSVDFIPGDPGAIDLTEAEIVIAGGKGLGSGSDFKLVDELAKAIGGTVGATRRAVDEEWITSDKQIGLTGKTVRPKLFIACGISGAIQHTMGMKDSGMIVAINTDRNAPIFKIADVGVVGDILEVLPSLTTQIREVLAQNPED